MSFLFSNRSAQVYPVMDSSGVTMTSAASLYSSYISIISLTLPLTLPMWTFGVTAATRSIFFIVTSFVKSHLILPFHNIYTLPPGDIYFNEVHNLMSLYFRSFPSSGLVRRVSDNFVFFIFWRKCFKKRLPDISLRRESFFCHADIQ